VRSRRADWVLAGLLAAVSYIPIFLTRPGWVAADTKQYLYLDPGKLTVGAASMWDPNTAMGTVTHQNIGYLFPMGPYYTVVDWLGIPVWVGQRIWMGSLLFFAGLGVAYCARRLGVEGPGRAVAALAYMLTPYTIDYLDRTSAILMPWAALGWMVGLTAAAARTGRWRYPAIFAVVVALVGGVNATSILLVLAAPALFLIHAVWVTHEVTLRRAVATAARIGGLCLLVSLWWIAGLWAEMRYGIDVLRATETVPTVSSTSSASEVLRGLGYWYFYGWDKVQPWTLPAGQYTQSLWLIGLSLGVPALCIAFGFVTRWRYRSLALGMVGLGTVVAVGAFPYSHPSLFGALIKSASTGSTLALAGRSVDRIVPVVLLGLSLLLGAGVTAVGLRWPRLGTVAALASVAVIAADLPALWTGGMIASNLSRPSSIPTYWTDATSYLNSQGPSSRVLGLPGEDFAAYSWGVTNDPVAPGLLDRPYVGRQVVLQGTPASANLLQALDEPLQQGTLDTAALAPLARIMSVGQILLQSDLQYERYDLPLPQVLWEQMNPPPNGLGQPKSFGAPNPAPTIRYPLNSESRLGLPTGAQQPPALAVFNVSDPRALVRTESTDQPIVVAGDGSGLVEAAGAGLLEGDQTILYAASLAQNPAEFQQAMAAGATLVLTDTNPLATYRWGSLRDNVGQVQQPGVGDLSSDPSTYALPVFPGETTADQTIAEVAGIKSVAASQYGSSLSFTPENRPINALDGNLSTAWTFGARVPVSDVRLQVDLDQPVTTNHVNLTQAQLVHPNRRITSVTLRFDGKDPVTVPLNSSSYRSPGQVVTFPTHTFSQLELTVNGATGGADKKYDGLSSVGFAEIDIPGVSSASESLRLPTDLLLQAGAASLNHPLVILMQRNRVNGPPRQDPELEMSRTLTLPTSRTFSVGGTAEINAGDSDYLINQLIGLTPSGPLPAAEPASPGPATLVAANSSTRLDGDRNARANAALDGDAKTAWIAETGTQAGEWMNFTFNKPVTVSHLDLQVVNDGRHSLPTRITISSGSQTRTVSLPAPAVGTGRPQGSTSTIPITFPSITGATIKFTIDSVKEVTDLDYYSTFTGTTDILPVGIAELGIPGVDEPTTPVQLPANCNSGLLTIDGNPVDVGITGTTASALSGDPLTIKPCGNSAHGITLSAGSHVIQTSPRLPSGWSIDQLSLESNAGGGSGLTTTGPSHGGAATTVSTGTTATSAVNAVTGATTEDQSPALHLDSDNRTSWQVTVNGNGQPFWLVLGQSFSRGWTATLPGGHSLGPAQLVDGYATGWYVPAGRVQGPTVVTMTWTPQRVVWAAITVSAAALLGSILMAVWPERWMFWKRRRRGGAARREGARRRDLAPRGSSPSPASWRAVMARGGTRPSLTAVALSSLGWGVVVAAVSRPAIGLAAALAAAAGCWWSGGRFGVRMAALVTFVAVGGYDVEQQWAHHYWPDINWPGNLSSANDLAWLALALVGSDLVAGLARTRLSRTSTLGEGTT
jgi:arabinofuranan 3-O-arabinosyltransferase